MIHGMNTFTYIKGRVQFQFIMIYNILYICSTCNKIQSTLTKHIVLINRHNFYQCLFPSFFVSSKFSKSAWNTDAKYIQSKIIKILKYGFGPQYTFKFDKIWTYVKDVIIRKQRMIMSLFLVPLWLPRKKNTGRSTNITNTNLTR